MTQRARDFMAANDRSPVVSGSAREPNPNKPSKGATYMLDNRDRWRLNLDDCQALLPGYPKWKI